MNVRKHLAGFAIFSVILGSAILINHFLTIPDAVIAPVINRPEAISVTVKDVRQPVTFRVRQVSLDYINKKSYTELSLFSHPDVPLPEKIWVMTTYFSPDSELAEDWTVIKEIRQPFASGAGETFVAASDWDLPPRLDKPGAGYFARVYVSSEHQGKFYEPDYSAPRDIAKAVPVVVHWPDKTPLAGSTAKKRSR